MSTRGAEHPGTGDHPSQEALLTVQGSSASRTVPDEASSGLSKTGLRDPQEKMICGGRQGGLTRYGQSTGADRGAGDSSPNTRRAVGEYEVSGRVSLHGRHLLAGFKQPLAPARRTPPS